MNGSPKPANRANAKAGEGSLIGKSVRLDGDLKADEALTIAGKFKGSINIPKSQVNIAKDSYVEANVSAAEIKIQGQIRGDVQGVKRVELTSTADLVGELNTREIRVEEGAVFRGRVNIITDRDESK